jgi:hypothetical protein
MPKTRLTHGALTQPEVRFYPRNATESSIDRFALTNSNFPRIYPDSRAAIQQLTIEDVGK